MPMLAGAEANVTAAVQAHGAAAVQAIVAPAL
jgi:hypothetical protein